MVLCFAMRVLDQLRQTSANAREVTRNVQLASDDVAIAARTITKAANAGMMAFVLVAIVAVVALGLATVGLMSR